jgi:hypothetical protein
VAASIELCAFASGSDADGDERRQDENLRGGECHCGAGRGEAIERPNLEKGLGDGDEDLEIQAGEEAGRINPAPGAPAEAAPAERGRPNADAPANRREQQQAATPRPGAPVEAAPVEAAPAERGRPNADAPANRREQQQAATPRPGAPLTATGKIKAWDATRKVVTLDNNTTCTLAAGTTAPAGIAVGKNATLTYATVNGANMCSAIKVK